MQVKRVHDAARTKIAKPSKALVGMGVRSYHDARHIYIYIYIHMFIHIFIFIFICVYIYVWCWASQTSKPLVLERGTSAHLVSSCTQPRASDEIRMADDIKQL